MDLQQSLPQDLLDSTQSSVEDRALWSIQTDDRLVSCVLRDHGRFGIEAHILVNGDVRIRRQFQTKESAVRWAATKR